MASFKSYIAKNLNQNCTITIDNINRDQWIYVTPIPILKGNTTKQFNPENYASTIALTLNISENTIIYNCT